MRPGTLSRTPAAVPARARGGGAPLPPAADARRGGPRAVQLAAPAAARVRAVRRAPASRRTCSRGAWPPRPSCWSSSGRSRCATWRAWSATARRSHFARAFRRRYGLSPARFRERARRRAQRGPAVEPRPWASDGGRVGAAGVARRAAPALALGVLRDGLRAGQAHPHQRAAAGRRPRRRRCRRAARRPGARSPGPAPSRVARGPRRRGRSGRTRAAGPPRRSPARGRAR